MYKQISSFQNPMIKKLIQLQEKSRIRKKEGLFVVEGLRELQLAAQSGYEMVQIFFCPERLPHTLWKPIEMKLPHQSVVNQVTPNLYERIAIRGSTEGIIAICKSKGLTLDKIQLPSDSPLLLIAEAPEKPGNIGALLRTADAAGVDAVIIADPKGDLYNPNIIRSSVGCLFTNQIASGSTKEVLAFLKENHIGIYAAALQGAEDYWDIDLAGATAIVVGTEATGLSSPWLQEAHSTIKIPMAGEIDSMNVSVAAGILIFEAKRQRRQKTPLA